MANMVKFFQEASAAIEEKRLALKALVGGDNQIEGQRRSRFKEGNESEGSLENEASTNLEEEISALEQGLKELNFALKGVIKEMSGDILTQGDEEEKDSEEEAEAEAEVEPDAEEEVGAEAELEPEAEEEVEAEVKEPEAPESKSEAKPLALFPGDIAEKKSQEGGAEKKPDKEEGEEKSKSSNDLAKGEKFSHGLPSDLKNPAKSNSKGGGVAPAA